MEFQNKLDSVLSQHETNCRIACDNFALHKKITRAESLGEMVKSRIATKATINELIDQVLDTSRNEYEIRAAFGLINKEEEK